MKQIRTTTAKVINASEPTITSNILFNNFEKYMQVEQQRYVVKFNSSKIIPAIVGTGTAQNPEFPETYEFIKSHVKIIGDPSAKNPISLADLDTMVNALTITETTTIGKEIQEMLEITKSLIDTEGFYGLTLADLVIE